MKPSTQNTLHSGSSNGTSSDSNHSNADTLERLRSQLRSLENGQKTLERNADRISSGCDALDQMLPGDGFLPGQLVEWLAEGGGHGGSTLAFMIARAAIQPRNGSPAKTLVVIDRTKDLNQSAQRSSAHRSFDGNAAFYPPAAAELGIYLQQLVVLRPNTAADEIWAIDQALRCPCVGAVWAWMPKLNDRDFRRFQLAAETGGTLGLLIRPARTRGEPTWADLQFLVEARPSVTSENRASATPEANAPPPAVARRHWKVTLLRCRGGTAGKQIFLELDETNGTLSEMKTNLKRATSTEANRHEKSPLPLATQLANPASRRSTPVTSTPVTSTPVTNRTPPTRNRNSA